MDTLLLISTPDGKKLTISPEKKILKKEEYALLIESNTVLEKAEEEAKKIIEAGHLEYTKQSKLGYEEGLNEGKLEIAEHMMDTLTKGVDYLENMETMVVDLVMASLGRVLEDLSDGERVVAQVKSALNYTRNQKKVLLRICPDEAEFVLKYLNELQHSKAIGFIDVVPDSRLSKGDCILESELGIVDASLHTQLEGIRRSFVKRLIEKK